MASILVSGDTSGSITISAPAVSGTNTLTLPAVTDTLVGKATTDTLTNKTLTSPTITGATITVASTAAPAFSAYATATQSIATATTTKITYGSEDYDTNANFATNRFTPTVAGYYQISAGLFCAGAAAGGNILSLYKNGADYVQLSRALLSGAFNVWTGGSVLVYLNGSTDYVEIYTTQNSGSTLSMGNGAQNGCWFTGFLARSA